MSMTFAYDATSVVTRSPLYGSLRRAARLQKRNAAIGGRIVTSDLADGSSLVRPRFTLETTWTEWASLKSFLQTTVQESALDFDWTDWEGDTYTVRYWSGIETEERLPGARARVTIDLREVPT